MQPLDLRQVKVGGEIGRRLDATVQNNFLVIDVDNLFLAPFKQKTAKEGYVGLGKQIDSAVKFAAYTGDEKVLARKKYLVDSAIAAQDPDGYLGILAPGERMKVLWDLHEMGYLIYGLTSDWHYFHEQKSLDAARKIADYILVHWKELPADWRKQTGVVTDLSTAGLERALITLARETGEKKYLEFCLKERQLLEWNKDIEVGRRPGVEGHIYAYLSRCLALQELSRMPNFEIPQSDPIAETRPSPVVGFPGQTRDGELLKQPRKAWDFMMDGGMTITGGCGQWECWNKDQDGRGALGETCTTAYQLRLLANAQQNGVWVSNFGDLMERTIYNALFAAQSPDGRKIRYYSPFEGKRDYFWMDNYCCPCNFRRIVAELPEMIYYHTGDLANFTAGHFSQNKIAVNLYTPSTAKIPLTIDSAESEAKAETPGDAKTPKTMMLTLRQETDYPNSGKITLFVDPEKKLRFEIDLRIPRWCKNPKITINGKTDFSDGTSITSVEPGSFCQIHRDWKPGDRVDLDLPMEWRFVLGKDRQAGSVAVMRGPVVFCLNPLRNENEAFKDWDAADIGRCVLMPDSIEGPIPDNSVRPNGMACRIKAFKPGCNCETPDVTFLLTEFPDPDGRAVYFRLQDLATGVNDELFRSKGTSSEFPGL
jgi:DUF1680 family protein